ncbi:MAG TPA: hypothetical protein VGW12_14375 [Pyrinomonadaceae bacterium]|nr:hypothetical protein [Pyrinomonadaceae bacterium]
MKVRADDTLMIEREVDARITYPCYKSLDDLIDVERLKSLDAYMKERIARRLSASAGDYFLNQHRLDAATPYQPGAREIWLTRTLPGTPYDYLDLNRTELWRLTKEASEFAALLEFIETLPFKETGRMLVIYDDTGAAVPAHRDHLETEVLHEFIWFRTNLGKPFYMLNHHTDTKLYVESYTAWFDTVNQFHGSDARPGLSFSIRVDGIFSDEFRRRIPVPERNLASTPALWACLTD